MKRKSFFVVLFLILAIFLSGCSSGIGTTPPSQSLEASFTAVTTTAEVGPESVHFVVHFDAFSSNGNIVSYTWNFKDSDPNLFSNTGNGKIIDRTFSFSGNYNVELTVDNKGATDSTTKPITLLPNDLEFIATIEELDTPEKIGN
jgi:PKD repeat protein